SGRRDPHFAVRSACRIPAHHPVRRERRIMTVLVTGGAGYIGSHMCLALLEQGEDVVVLDNLSTGLRALVPPECTFVKGCVGDDYLVRAILAHHDIDAVIHFAGAAVVPESVERPFFYYRNNAAETRNLLETVADAGV